MSEGGTKRSTVYEWDKPSASGAGDEASAGRVSSAEGASAGRGVHTGYGYTLGAGEEGSAGVEGVDGETRAGAVGAVAPTGAPRDTQPEGSSARRTTRDTAPEPSEPWGEAEQESSSPARVVRDTVPEKREEALDDELEGGAAPVASESRVEGETAGVAKSDKGAARIEPEEAPALSRATLARALSAATIALFCVVVVWWLGRPTTLLRTPALSVAAAAGALPECSRIRFSLVDILADKWRAPATACLRGDCEGLRSALVTQGFSASSWRLVLPGEDPEGCVVEAGQRPRGDACGRLAALVDGGADDLQLQVEGECQERP